MLNAVIALILRFFSPNSTDYHSDYITPIMSAKLSPSSSLPLLAKTILQHALR